MATTFWNTEDTFWNLYDTFWNEEVIIPIVTATGMASPIESNIKDINLSENKVKEQFIKVFLTIHNQFLTEQQKHFIKITQLYPSYKEQKEIKKKVNVILENISLEQKEHIKKIPAKIKIQNIKIGLEKIVNYVTDNSPK
jgi:hypothetical protein